MSTTAALLVIDVVNPYEHDDADALAANVAGTVGPLHDLIERARAARAEVVYVNDNYEDFAATREDLVRRALDGRHPELVEPLLPGEGCAFLQKVRHSAFYCTALDHLLRRRETGTVILAGQVTEQCILYSALDAYVRHYDIRIAADAVAAIDPRLGDAALQLMHRNMRATITPAASAFDGL